MPESGLLADRISRAAEALREAEKPLRILSLLAWPPELRERFLADDGGRMPAPEYPAVDPEPIHRALTDARRRIRDTGPAATWLERTADRIESAAAMISRVGTPDFHAGSTELYGSPNTPIAEAATTPLALAKRLRRIIDRLKGLDLGEDPEPDVPADVLARRMRHWGRRQFGDLAPEVELVDHLSANATASVERIRIRQGTAFSERDVEQLIHHEAGIHVATALNGREQVHLPILAASHPGTTRTQEGLAVFAEFISGAMDLDRLERLADRVIAIDMAERGADFIEVYRHFRDREATPENAFEQARRVFRGGVMAGGAPFTKDVVYLDGLLRVHDFLRSAVAAGRADCLQLMFCGKLDIEDIPVLCDLAALGLVRAPRFLPPWAADRRFLVSYLAYSGFLNRVRLSHVKHHYAELLASAPVVDFSAATGDR